MIDFMPTLVWLRQIDGKAPVIVVPYAIETWLGVERIKNCEICALPDKPVLGDQERMQWASLVDPVWWMQLFRRDVAFWPVDIWSAVVFIQITNQLAATELRKNTFSACRWVWCDNDDPAKVVSVQTLWKRDPALTLRAAE